MRLTKGRRRCQHSRHDEQAEGEAPSLAMVLEKVVPVAGRPPTGEGASHGSEHVDRQLKLPEFAVKSGSGVGRKSEGGLGSGSANFMRDPQYSFVSAQTMFIR